MTNAPLLRSVATLACVAGCSHISVCMAGANSTGHRAVSSVLVGVRSPAELREDVATYARPVPGELWRELVELGLLRGQVPVPAGAP